MKLTQTDFGKRLGVTMRTVQNWEADVNLIPKAVQIIITESTDISHTVSEPDEFYNKVETK